MKKITFKESFRTVALALLCCLSLVQAQAQNLNEILAANNGIVKITGKRAGTAMYDTGNGMRLKTPAPGFESQSNWDQLWIIQSTGSNGTYSVCNVKTGNYLGEGGGASSGSYSFYIDGHNGYFVFGQEDKYPEGNKYINESNGGLTTWSIDDGSLWTIEAVEGITPEQIRTYRDEAGGFSKLQDGKIYEIISFAYGHCLTENFTSNRYVGQDRFNTASQYFRVKAQGSGQYSFQNVSSKRYVQGTPGTSSYYVPGTSVVYHTVVAGGEFDNYYTLSSGGSLGWHEANSQGNQLVSWYTNANASKWQFREVTLTDEEIEAAEKEYEEIAKYSGDANSYTATLQLFFEDAACSQLKPEFQSKTDGQLREAMNSLPKMIQDEAIKIKNNAWVNAYERGFRIAEYGAFSDASRGQQMMRLSNGLCLINNPTGIMANGGEYVFIIVGDDIPAGTTLKATTTVGYTHYAVQSVPLVKGVNFVLSENNNSHIFIEYTSPQDAVIADVPKLDIHVIGGRVEGYFDHKKHTDADWVAMQEAGLFQDKVMHILGTYSQLLVQTAGIKQYNPTKLLPLLGEFEWYCYTELEIMGLTAIPDSLKNLPDAIAGKAHEDLFPRVYNNRMLCVSDENSGSMYAGGNKICLGDAYMSSTYNYESIKNRGGEIWAPGHEYGHQMQSAIHMAASTEVSNNAFSNFLVFRGGTCTSRGWNVQRMQEEFADGTHNWPHIVSTDYWLPCQFYYSLYLYYHGAGNDPLFYQKLFRLLREDPMQNPAGNCTGQNDYLHFAKKCCIAANQDLSEFFEYWGFFEPVSNVTMASYSTWYMTTGARVIESTRNWMKENFPVKGNSAMIFIDDRVVTTYWADGETPKAAFGGEYPVEWCETKASGAQYSKFAGITLTDEVEEFGKTIDMSKNSWSFRGVNTSELAGFRFLDADGKLIYIAAPKGYVIDATTIPANIRSQVDRVELCYSNGKKILAVSTTSGIDDVLEDAVDPETGKEVYYDLTGRKVLEPKAGGVYIRNGVKVLFK